MTEGQKEKRQKDRQSENERVKEKTRDRGNMRGASVRIEEMKNRKMGGEKTMETK